MESSTTMCMRSCCDFLSTVVIGFVLALSSQIHAQPSVVAATAKTTDTAALYKKANAAFVEILVDGHMAGSGAFVDEQGYVITASHVIGRRGRRLEVLSPIYGRLKAELIAVDLGHDLALLKVPPREKGYTALLIAQEIPEVGQMCYLIGTPLYRHALLLSGMVARPQPGFEFMPNTKSYAEVYYVAGPSPPGTSGGAWVNEDGELVGVQSMLMSVLNSAHGISFVVPPAAVTELLKNKRSASTPTLNLALEEIWQHASEVRDSFAEDATGLLVRSSRKGCPARKAGLKEWHLIQSIDDKPLERMEDFVNYIRTKKPGDRVKLDVLVPGETKLQSVAIPLIELESMWSNKQQESAEKPKEKESKEKEPVETESLPETEPSPETRTRA